MPELPDVEVFRRYFAATALHKKITKVEVHHQKILEAVSSRRLKKALEGRSFKKTSRHGKYLFAELDSGDALVLHFGMTGFLKYYKKAGQKPEHDRLTLHLENDYQLAYANQRLLGRVFLTSQQDRFIENQELGPDALDLGLAEFASILEGGRGAAKTTLMNQKRLAGLGNIYTDEIFFQSRIHPKESVKTLTKKQLETLFENMQEVLNTAIEAQADPKQMPEEFLLPHREEGEPCPRCGGEVKKVKLSGRSTYFCPACQSESG